MNFPRAFFFFFACCCVALMGATTGADLRGASLRFTYGNSTYEINENLAGWVQAKNDCRSRGMGLVSIESAEEHYAILEYITDYTGGRFWTSGSDIEQEGDFYWEATGALLSYTNWAAGQPNNYLEGHCVEITDQYAYQWNDVTCTDPIMYICESQSCVALH
ncbi:perlucin-like protein [Cloeon dipterum]|uniref:perlucin-like protein n=1 Tax=Cloeon dipterum TaxID=197152 RepID=UPI00321F9F0F